MKIKMMFVGFFAIFLFVNVFAGEKILLAVYDFSANEVKPVLADSVADFIQTSLYKTGRFNLVERKNMGKILKEQAFQQTGCTSMECAVEVGRILNVNSIITGTVSKTGQMLVISMQLVDVEKGDITLSDKIECDSEDLLNTAASVLAVHFSKGVAIKGEVVKILNENEIIINIGVRDGIEIGQELNVERLGEGVKDKTGTIIFQKRAVIAKVQATVVEEAATSFKLVEKSGDIKEGDIIEIKKEKLDQLEPLKTKSEAKNLAVLPGHFYVGIDAAYGFHMTFSTNYDGIAPVGFGTVENHFIGPCGGIGGNLLGGNASWVVDSFVGIQTPLDGSHFNVNQGYIGEVTGYLGLRFYPLTPLLNPGYLKAKTWNEVRGFFAPYVGVVEYVTMWTCDIKTVPVGYGGTLQLGPQFTSALVAGADIANLFYIEVVDKFGDNTSTISIPEGGYSNPPAPNYNIHWTEDSADVAAGIRFNF